MKRRNMYKVLVQRDDEEDVWYIDTFHRTLEAAASAAAKHVKKNRVVELLDPNGNVIQLKEDIQ